jgi:ribosomal protein S27AE
MVTKVCKKCGEEKDIEDFSKGRYSCKTCVKRQRVEHTTKISNQTGLRTCNQCGIEKDSTDFYKGYLNCKQCVSEYQKNWYKHEQDKLETTTKLCETCGLTKPYIEFNKKSNTCNNCKTKICDTRKQKRLNNNGKRICNACGIEKNTNKIN